MDKPLVIYHYPCDDGFGAAYCAWRKFRDDADYMPMSYGQAPPDVTGRTVYILDFSFKSDPFYKMLNQAKHVTWLDHHKTAFEQWVGGIPEGGEYEEKEPHYYIRLDNNKSGAMLAHEHFHPDEPVPSLLICYVQDNDLWRHKMPGSRAFTRNLRSHPYLFEEWHKIANYSQAKINAFIEEGEAIDRFYFSQLRSHVDNVKRPCTIDGIPGLAANLPSMFASDGGHMLANESGTLGLTWYQARTGGIHCSLRANGGIDVSAISARRGGGGHRNAAGFTLKSFADLEKLFR
jgi:oligoribonuclease NrnB/cAMP/cGMP phosphodiesterase (DHH superfamily)